MSAAGGGKSGVKVALAMMAVALAIAFALPSVLLLVIGMAPTIVALGLEHGRTRGIGRSVGTLNLCGVAPYLGQLWIGDHGLVGLGALLAAADTWLFMYGAAGLGWLLCYSMPAAVAMYLGVRDERRVRQLRSRRQALVKEWGPGVGRMIEPGADTEDASTARSRNAAR